MHKGVLRKRLPFTSVVKMAYDLEGLAAGARHHATFEGSLLNAAKNFAKVS
jgi:hypothetical protein